MDQSKLHDICKLYQGKPVEYAEDILGIRLTADQKNILILLTQKPRKVLVRSANTQGKSFLAAVAALYHYDCFDPSITLITAPVFKQIQSIIFKEIRTIGKGREGFSPKAPVLFDSPKHQIVGVTASDSTSLQGIHDASVAIIADELTGIDAEFVEAYEPMLGGAGWFFLGLFNPTDQNSFPFTAERTGKYHVVHLSALDHENIQAELQGHPAPFPTAIRLDRLREMIDLWCTEAKDWQTGDFQFDGKMWRPSPVAECRILGRWPSIANNSIWTDALFEAVTSLDVNDEGTTQIGCDVATFGDDDTAIAVRRGRNLVHLEQHNGWSPNQTVGRLKELAEQFKTHVTHRIPVVIDDTGIGISVSCQGGDYNFIGVNFASKSFNSMLYRNKRDEMWFTLADKAKSCEVSFKQIPKYQLEDIRRELLAPTYSLDYQARRIVEKKSETKKRIGKSPDLADAILLAYCHVNADVFDVLAPEPIKPARKFGLN